MISTTLGYFARLGFLLLVLGMYGCSSSYYQILETASPDAPIRDGFHVFENDDIQVVYDFWSSGGSMRFQIWNKTSVPLYIDWEKSHLVHNGRSLDYWDDKVISTSFYASTEQLYLREQGTVIFGPGMINTYVNTKGSSTKRSTTETEVSKPKRVINLPPRSAVTIERYQLVPEWLYDCDFNLKAAKKGRSVKKTFDRSDTPLSFRNFLVYALDDDFMDERYIDNSFHIATAEFVPYRSYWGPDRVQDGCDVYGAGLTTTIRSRTYKKGSAFYQTR